MDTFVDTFVDTFRNVDTFGRAKAVCRKGFPAMLHTAARGSMVHRGRISTFVGIFLKML